MKVIVEEEIYELVRDYVPRENCAVISRNVFKKGFKKAMEEIKKSYEDIDYIICESDCFLLLSKHIGAKSILLETLNNYKEIKHLSRVGYDYLIRYPEELTKILK